jgi:hypothetical protein
MREGSANRFHARRWIERVDTRAVAPFDFAVPEHCDERHERRDVTVARRVSPLRRGRE